MLRGMVWLVCAAAVGACGGVGTAPDFTLRDDGGSLWTLSSQRGETVLLTFGFTHCTDTCPATLAKLIRLSGTRQRSRDVEIAFVTIDPARDTVAVMHRFLARFAHLGDARLVGLTGTPAEVERVKTAYHIWSQPLSTKPGHDIAHTAVIFFIDSRGRIAAVSNDDDSEQSLARELAQMLPAS
jgi:protein SCO1